MWLWLQGLSGLWSGAMWNILRGVAASIVLVLYGEIQIYLKRSKAIKDEAANNEATKDEEDSE